jgi:hypothetical protein
MWTKIKENIQDGPTLYAHVKRHAEGIKAVLQIVIGIAFMLLLIVQLSIHLDEPLTRAANRAFVVIGAALAFSAVIELAYTFFTDGPDEALNPLILGISAFALIRISNTNLQLNAIALPVLLLALAIVALLIARRFLLMAGNQAGEKKTNQTKPPSDLSSH